LTQQPIVLPGVTLESTTQAGGFAVPTGKTLYGAPPRKTADPGAARPYKAEKYVAAAAVTELPGVTSKPDNLRHFYPHEAEQRGFEGDVVLRLLIDADGSLAKVDLVSDPGEGLGAAGVRAIQRVPLPAGQAERGADRDDDHVDLAVPDCGLVAAGAMRRSRRPNGRRRATTPRCRCRYPRGGTGRRFR
jgi:Gram-negative bacterial TonB protein C-terminal